MDQTAVEKVSIAAERLLEKGDREALRQMVLRLNELLLRGLSEEQGGPVPTDPEILAVALRLQMRKVRDQTNVGKAVAQRLCENYRETFIQDVTVMCGSQLTREEEELVAAKFNIVLCYWLRTAAELIQSDTKDYHDLEVVGGG